MLNAFLKEISVKLCLNFLRTQVTLFFEYLYEQWVWSSVPSYHYWSIEKNWKHFINIQLGSKWSLRDINMRIGLFWSFSIHYVYCIMSIKSLTKYSHSLPWKQSRWSGHILVLLYDYPYLTGQWNFPNKPAAFK